MSKYVPVRERPDNKCPCSGFHWHPWGLAHEHGKHDQGHHGSAFGKKQVVFVEEPSLELLLRKSIEREEAKRDASPS